MEEVDPFRCAFTSPALHLNTGGGLKGQPGNKHWPHVKQQESAFRHSQPELDRAKLCLFCQKQSTP